MKIIILISLVLILLAMMLPALLIGHETVVEFPDPHLRAAVRRNDLRLGTFVFFV